LLTRLFWLQPMNLRHPKLTMRPLPVLPFICSFATKPPRADELDEGPITESDLCHSICVYILSTYKPIRCSSRQTFYGMQVRFLAVFWMCDILESQTMIFIFTYLGGVFPRATCMYTDDRWQYDAFKKLWLQWLQWGGDLQPGCLGDRLLTGLGQPQINP